METEWEQMRERLMGLTMRQLRQLAKAEGVCLGYAGSRKDTAVAEIVGQRRHRAMDGKVVTTGVRSNRNDWCRQFGSIRAERGKR